MAKPDKYGSPFIAANYAPLEMKIKAIQDEAMKVAFADLKKKVLEVELPKFIYKGSKVGHFSSGEFGTAMMKKLVEPPVTMDVVSNDHIPPGEVYAMGDSFSKLVKGKVVEVTHFNANGEFKKTNFTEQLIAEAIAKGMSEGVDKLILSGDPTYITVVHDSVLVVEPKMEDLTDDQIHSWLMASKVPDWPKGTMIEVEVTDDFFQGATIEGSMYNRLVYRLRKAGMPVGVQMGGSLYYHIAGTIKPGSMAVKETAQGVAPLYGAVSKVFNMQSNSTTYRWTHE